MGHDRTPRRNHICLAGGGGISLDVTIVDCHADERGNGHAVQGADRQTEDDVNCGLGKSREIVPSGTRL